MGKNFVLSSKCGGGVVKYKKIESIQSISGSTNKSGIRISNDCLYLLWGSLKIRLQRNLDDYYECQAFSTGKICRTRILRKMSKSGRYTYYAQILFEGLKPRNICKETGAFKNKIGSGKVGVYVGIRNVTIFDGNQLKQFDFNQGQDVLFAQIKKNDLAMNRIRRHLNPNKFDAQGHYIADEPSDWVISNRYIQLKNKNKYLYKKRTNKIKHIHEKIANEILAFGNHFVINVVDGKANAAFRKNEINAYAPSSFCRILKNKILDQDGMCQEVHTSNFNYTKYVYEQDRFYKEDEVFQAWINFYGTKVHYKWYYAFLFYAYENGSIQRQNESGLHSFLDSIQKIENNQNNDKTGPIMTEEKS